MDEHDCCGHGPEPDVDPLAAIEMAIKARQWAYLIAAGQAQGAPFGAVLERAHVLAEWLIEGEPPIYDDEVPGETPLPPRSLKPGEPGDYN